NTNKISLIAYYIYYHYMRDFVTSTTNTGEVLSNNENANKVTPADKMSNAWSRYLELYGKITDGSFEPSAYRYLVENESDFDLWLFKAKRSINSFDI
ncbi:hypothetical protein KA005_52975, partial [bacterium]|nr:hypothetical protein [bacterium]